ncbi:hypothetical protein GCM10022276_14000 [Sphingomonas limnosediminicola]|uniref:Uncharacterized protein n=1 Tax=Sphingomonas limnosediminicola TaxID=940133 RepID=A0ABP7L8Q1_9SPHN
MLDHGLGIGREVLEISQAHTINTRRLPADPAAPDQSGDIKQERRVVDVLPRQGTIVRAVATGMMEELTMFTNRCSSAVREFET